MTKPRKKKRQPLINPLSVLKAKELVGQKDADGIAMPLMIHLDAAKRGQCPNEGVNFLYKHLIIASVIAARAKSKQFYDMVNAAYEMLKKAAARPTETLDLTTGEYKALKEALSAYIAVLPTTELGALMMGCEIAKEQGV